MTEAPQLRHVVSGRPGKMPVHYLSLDIDQALCGRGEMWIFLHGALVQRMFFTSDPVDCKGCRKAMEMLVRHTLSRVSRTEDLEALYKAAFVYAQNGGPGGQ